MGADRSARQALVAVTPGAGFPGLTSAPKDRAGAEGRIPRLRGTHEGTGRCCSPSHRGSDFEG